MRELIYLSERKLQQFQADRQAGWWRRIRQIGGKAPLGFGEIQVALSDEEAKRYPQLGKVLKQIERSDRAAKWYEDNDVEPGTWVHFEAPLNYFLLEDSAEEHRPAALIFLQPPPVESGRNKVRLVLHGAPQHLIGGNREVQSGSLTPSTSYVFFNLLERLFADGDITPRGAQDLVEVAAHDLDRIHAAATASWMAGYARATMRVTAQSVNSPEEPGLPTFVVASPLYVEYVSNPSRDG